MRRVLMVLMVVGLIGCGPDDESRLMVQVGTFNAGLARGYVDHAELRFEKQLSALGEMSTLDILCLQEVWSPRDRQVLIERLSSLFPYSYYQDTTNESLFPDAEAEPAACIAAEAEPLAECARRLCDGDPDIATCVLSNCGGLFDALSPKCQECAASNIGLGSVDEILSVCLTEGSVGYSYDGQNGLLLLSTAPMEEKEFVQFDSFLISRGVLVANTHGLDVACTHLTSRLADPVYSGAYGSYEAENAYQIDQLLSVIEGRAASGPKVLFGDFNAGPMVGELSAELPENYAKFEAGGWINPNTSSAQPLCTWCPSNLITRGTANEAIDHVFVKGADADQPTRILGEPITVTRDDGTEFMTSYSDHFGVSVWLTLP